MYILYIYYLYMDYLKYIIINQCGGSVLPQINLDNFFLNDINTGNSYYYLITPVLESAQLTKTEVEILKLYQLLKIKVPKILKNLNFTRDSTYDSDRTTYKQYRIIFTCTLLHQMYTNPMLYLSSSEQLPTQKLLIHRKEITTSFGEKVLYTENEDEYAKNRHMMFNLYKKSYLYEYTKFIISVKENKTYPYNILTSDFTIPINPKLSELFKYSQKPNLLCILSPNFWIIPDISSGLFEHDIDLTHRHLLYLNFNVYYIPNDSNNPEYASIRDLTIKSIPILEKLKESIVTYIGKLLELDEGKSLDDYFLELIITTSHSINNLGLLTFKVELKNKLAQIQKEVYLGFNTISLYEIIYNLSNDVLYSNLTMYLYGSEQLLNKAKYLKDLPAVIVAHGGSKSKNINELKYKLQKPNKHIGGALHKGFTYNDYTKQNSFDSLQTSEITLDDQQTYTVIASYCSKTVLYILLQDNSTKKFKTITINLSEKVQNINQELIGQNSTNFEKRLQNPTTIDGIVEVFNSYYTKELSNKLTFNQENLLQYDTNKNGFSLYSIKIKQSLQELINFYEQTTIISKYKQLVNESTTKQFPVIIQLLFGNIQNIINLVESIYPNSSNFDTIPSKIKILITKNKKFLVVDKKNLNKGGILPVWFDSNELEDNEDFFNSFTCWYIPNELQNEQIVIILHQINELYNSTNTNRKETFDNIIQQLQQLQQLQQSEQSKQFNKCIDWKFIVPQLELNYINDLIDNFIKTILKNVYPSQTSLENSILSLFNLNNPFYGLSPHIHIYLLSRHITNISIAGSTNTTRSFNLFEYINNIDNIDMYYKILINSIFSDVSNLSDIDFNSLKNLYSV